MKRFKILAVNSEWASRNGGLSTLNRELCVGLAARGHEVHCYVPDADEGEIQSAAAQNVKLVIAPRVGGLKWCCRLCLKPKAELNPDIIIGHDHISGSTIHVLGGEY